MAIADGYFRSLNDFRFVRAGVAFAKSLVITKTMFIKALFLFLAALIANQSIAGKVLDSDHAGNTLFVSKPTGQHADEYLSSMQTQLASGFINCAVKLYGDGKIQKAFCDSAQKAAAVGIHRIRDYRKLGGKEWLFLSTKTQTKGDETKHCVLEAGALKNCFSMPFLDPHDFLIAKNGDRIYMFYEPRLNEKRWLSGKALDLVLRRINANGEVVWTWSSAKDFNVSYKPNPQKTWISNLVRWSKEVRTSVMTNFGVDGEHPFCVDLFGVHCMQNHYIDYMHANSLEWDGEGGVIVSGRDINTIFKIDLNTGAVEWRIGGYHADKSDFTIVNDPFEGFSYQHSARILPNNHLLLFDNGNDRPDKKTRVVEYELDFEKKTATYVWGHTAPDDFPFRRCCGAVQRLANGNSFIAWGGWKIGAHDRESILVAQELSKTGDVVSEIRSTVQALPYRVWKVEDGKSR